MGSVALDLASTACGATTRSTSAWDIAAGSLLCEYAGLVVRTLETDGVAPAGVVVAPPALIDELEARVT